MANVQIPNLPAAISLSGAEQIEGVQAGTSVRITTAQIGALTPTGPIGPTGPTGTISAAGSTTQILYNNAGAVAGAAGLTTDGTSLAVSGVVSLAAGTAAAPSLTATGDTNTGLYFPAADTVAVTTGGAERVRVTSTAVSSPLNIAFSRPSDFWSAGSNYFPATTNFGGLSSEGSNGVFLTSNGYRNNAGTWTSYGAGGATGASQIELLPTGEMRFRTDASKASGTAINPTLRMSIKPDGNVGIGTSVPDASALLDLTSTTQGFLQPRMTTAQRDAISSPVNGLTIYNTTLDFIQLYESGAWKNVGPALNAVVADLPSDSAAQAVIATSIGGTTEFANAVGADAGLVFSSRAAAIAATIPSNIYKISILIGSIPSNLVMSISFVRNPSGTALTTAGAVNWNPDGPVYADHFGENTVPGTTDMYSAITAGLAYLNSTVGGKQRGGNLCFGPFEYLSNSIILLSAEGVGIAGDNQPRSSIRFNTVGIPEGTVITGAHTSGPVIHRRTSDVTIKNITISATSTRQAAAISTGSGNVNCGILTEPLDNSAAIVAYGIDDNVLVRYQPADGFYYAGQIVSIVTTNCRAIECGRHGFVYDTGVLSGRLFPTRPGIFNNLNCRALNLGGHGLAIGNPSDGSDVPYRGYVLNFEAFRTGNDAALRYADAGNFVAGENIDLVLCAFSGSGGTSGNTPVREFAIFIAGRNVQFSGRLIQSLKHLKIGLQPSIATRNISAISVSAETTATIPAYFCEIDPSVVSVTLGNIFGDFVAPFDNSLTSVQIEWNYQGNAGWRNTGVEIARSSATLAIGPTLSLRRDRNGGIVNNGDNLGTYSAYGNSGVADLEAVRIRAEVDGAPGASDMPGRLTFWTTADGASTPTERMRIDNQGRIAVGTTAVGGASGAFRIAMPVTGAASSSGFLNTVSVQSDVTTARVYVSTPTVAASFALTNLVHYYASQGAIGAGSSVTTQVGYFAESNLVGAANNYGFQGVIANATQRTITNVERTSNVVTITTSVAHGFTVGQQVVIAATTNTGLNGTFTITAVPLTTTLQYAQTAADIPSGADTGTVNSAGRYNLYMSGSAPNYMAGNVYVATATPASTAYPLFVESTVGALVSGGTNTAATSPTIGVSRRRTGLASVISGDSLGKFSGFGWDGAAFVEASRIETVVDGTPGSSDMPGRLVFSTTVDGGSTPTERMRITNLGNVCIGTTAAGTSAEDVLAIGTGVAPTTGPADTIQIYSTDLSAGNTMLSIYTEGTSVNANTTADATHRIAVRINGTVYYLLANTAA